MSKRFSTCLISTMLLVSTYSVHAETMEQCMEIKRGVLLDTKTERVFSDYGCTTSGTEFVTKWDYQGFRTSVCDAPVCYPAPPGRVILEAKAQDHSANGSEHSWNGPHYSPDRERATMVCFNVHARSPHKDIGARGWQKLNVDVRSQRNFTDKEMIGMAVACASEGAK